MRPSSWVSLSLAPPCAAHIQPPTYRAPGGPPALEVAAREALLSSISMNFPLGQRRGRFLPPGSSGGGFYRRPPCICGSNYRVYLGRRLPVKSETAALRTPAFPRDSLYVTDACYVWGSPRAVAYSSISSIFEAQIYLKRVRDPIPRICALYWNPFCRANAPILTKADGNRWEPIPRSQVS